MKSNMKHPSSEIEHLASNIWNINYEIPNVNSQIQILKSEIWHQPYSISSMNTLFYYMSSDMWILKSQQLSSELCNQLYKLLNLYYQLGYLKSEVELMQSKLWIRKFEIQQESTQTRNPNSEIHDLKPQTRHRTDTIQTMESLDLKSKIWNPNPATQHLSITNRTFTFLNINYGI